MIAKYLILFTILIGLIFSRPFIKQYQASPSIQTVKKNQFDLINNNSKISSTRLDRNSRSNDPLILWYENFENQENVDVWSLNSGWELTEASSNSGSYSLLSSNNNINMNGSYSLLSPVLQLPTLGDGEIMHFGFSLYADMPDSDGDNDNNLEDYYSISIVDMTQQAWHTSSINSEDGDSFWCSDEEDLNGYMDNWLQFLDTSPIFLGEDGIFSARIYFSIEDDEGPFVNGSCTDGWDAANIRLSNDGGSTWILLEDPLFPYHFNCGYGWIWNDNEYEQGGDLSHLSKGWSGNSNGWQDFSVDLSTYAGDEIIIRFAFGSDPAYSTADNANLTGFQVDNVLIEDNSGIVFSDFAENMSQMLPGGESWDTQFYDYSSVEDGGRPGSFGWEQYLPGMAFNGNTFLDITNFSEKFVRFKIQTRYDDDHDGGQGEGLYIDDFIIYKVFPGAYFSPWGLAGEQVGDKVTLSWSDMNKSGNEDFIFDNGQFDPTANFILLTESDTYGWVGTLFDIIGPSVVNSVSIYNSLANSQDTTITIGAYGMFGSLFDTKPLYTKDVILSSGWNDIILDNWQMQDKFIIGYRVSSDFQADVDVSVYEEGGSLSSTDLHSVIRLDGAWEYIYAYGYEGEIGIRANITYEGAGVEYKLYRDDSNIASGLQVPEYIDYNILPNNNYNYFVTAVYPDGSESDSSNVLSITCLPESTKELYHDDGVFEEEFNSGSGNFSAVYYNFSCINTAQLVRFKWYQYGDGGAFYLKMFSGNESFPGEEVHSIVIASGNQDGWNEFDLSGENIGISQGFWIGVKEFSSSKPFGLDTNGNLNKSMMQVGTDEWIEVDGNLSFRVFLDGDSDCLDIESEDFIASDFRLNKIYPNPFNANTTIDYDLNVFGNVKVSIYDINGRIVDVLVDGRYSPGNYQVKWGGFSENLEEISSGVYLIELTVDGSKLLTEKILLLK